MLAVFQLFMLRWGASYLYSLILNALSKNKSTKFYLFLLKQAFSVIFQSMHFNRWKIVEKYLAVCWTFFLLLYLFFDKSLFYFDVDVFFAQRDKIVIKLFFFVHFFALLFIFSCSSHFFSLLYLCWDDNFFSFSSLLPLLLVSHIIPACSFPKKI